MVFNQQRQGCAKCVYDHPRHLCSHFPHRACTPYVRLWHHRFLCSSQWAWSWLDVIVVISSLLELISSLFVSRADAYENPASNLRILRTVRVIRATRVLRVIRIARYLRSLRVLVCSISCTLKPLFCSVLLLLLIMYICALLLTEAAISFVYVESESNDVAHLDKYFGTLHISLHTYFAPSPAASHGLMLLNLWS